MAPSTVTTLALIATTGTVALNRDGTHESSVMNLATTDGKPVGQLSLLMPVTTNPKNTTPGVYDGGIEPGEYSISISLTRKAEEVKATRTTSGTAAAEPTGASADASVGTTAERRRGTAG